MDPETNSYYVGQILPEYVGHQDASQYDMTDGGSYMLILLSSPTNAEIKSFYKSPTIVKLSVFKKAMWLTVKFSDLEWDEAPFNPHLAYRLTIPQGLHVASRGMIVMLINTLDGRILGMLDIDFSKQFGIVLESAVIFFRNQPFDHLSYDAFLEQVKNTYKPSEIAEMAIAETISTFKDSKLIMLGQTVTNRISGTNRRQNEKGYGRCSGDMYALTGDFVYAGGSAQYDRYGPDAAAG